MSEPLRNNYAFYDGGSGLGFSGLVITTDPLTTTWASSQFVSVSNVGSVDMVCALLTSKKYTTDQYPTFDDQYKTISLGAGEKFSDYITTEGIIIKTFGGETKAKLYVSW